MENGHAKYVDDFHREENNKLDSRRHPIPSPTEGGEGASIFPPRPGARCRVAPLAIPESFSPTKALDWNTSAPEVSDIQFPATKKNSRSEANKSEPGSDNNEVKHDKATTDDNNIKREIRKCSNTGMVPERIVICVGGQRFVTFVSTLHRIPGTRLSLLTKSDPSYDPVCGEYFFDRNPHIFGYILDFYRIGELHFPHTQCGPLLKHELDFWQISEDYIAPCCWKTYTEYEEEKKTLKILEETFNEPRKHLERHHVVHRMNGCKKWKQDLWIFLEDPTSCTFAQLFSYVYVVLLLMSIGVVVLETHPSCRVKPEQVETGIRIAQFNVKNFNENTTNEKLHMFITTEPHMSLIIIDYICTFFFSTELIVKFFVWPGKLDYFRRFFNIIDILSVTPMLINTIVTLVNPSFWLDHNIFIGYCILSVSSVFRCIRILKLVKHHRGLQIIFLAMRASLKAILLLLLLIAIGTLVFSTMIYFAEFEEDDNFETIPIGFWWSVVTMTTVGYGDKTPRTTLGYVVGSMCALTGMLITGLPIPVIANSFHLYYTYAGLKAKLDTQRACLKADAACGDYNDLSADRSCRSSKQAQSQM